MKKTWMRPAFAAIAVLIAVLAVQTFGSRNAGIEAIAAPDDKYKALDTFSQALGIVESAYVEQTEQKNVIYGAIKGMLQELDPHSTFYTPEEYKSFQIGTKGSFGGLGITIGMRDNALTVISPIEDTPAYKAGIKAGDTIIMIENEPTSGMNLEDAVSRMRGEPGTKVKITIMRKNEPQPIDFTIERAIIKLKSVKFAMSEGGIGYIRLTQFQEESSSEVSDALRALDKAGAKGIILDLRNNGGGLLHEAINIASIFLPAGQSVVYTKDRAGQETHYKTKRISYRDNTRPMVVIVNEGSASASEIMAGAMQDHERAVVIGSTTFGKASVQSVIEMKDGSAMKLTTARYYTPKGRAIQGVGIVPDIEVGAGKVEFAANPYVIKEKDLTGHLVGENEKAGGANAVKMQTSEKPSDEKAVILPSGNDVQYMSARQVLKGMMIYGKTVK